MRPLRQWGWSAFFADQAGAEPTQNLFRVTEVQRGKFRLRGAFQEVWGESRGKIRFRSESATDLPVVGDWVVVDASSPGGVVPIERILRRKTLLTRQAVDGSGEQPIAANIDTVVIATSMNQDFNLRRLERYLVMTWNSGAQPVILLTKKDLRTDWEACVTEVETIAVGVPILPISATSGEGVDSLIQLLPAEKTGVIVGSSGVGKSTLLNLLLGDGKIETQAVREEDDRGRHTTTARSLYQLPWGGILIDTPGVRELAPGGLSNETEGSGLTATFQEIEALKAQCRFEDCQHASEPNCAVRSALESGELGEDRWSAYLKLLREQAFHLRKRNKAAMSEQKKKWKRAHQTLALHPKYRR